MLSAIATQLEIDESKKQIHARYIVNGNSIAVDIHNDMCVKLYMEVKKHVFSFEMYPLCITTKDKEIYENMFEAELGAIECVEGVEMAGLALVVIDKVEDLFVTYMDVDHLITDCNFDCIFTVQIGRAHV